MWNVELASEGTGVTSESEPSYTETSCQEDARRPRAPLWLFEYAFNTGTVVRE